MDIPSACYNRGTSYQPVSEKEDKKGKIAYWFLKSETQWVYKKWNENRPVEQSKNMED